MLSFEMSQKYKYWGISYNSLYDIISDFCNKKTEMKGSIQNIFKGKCPKCHKGQVFETNGNPILLKMPKMHTSCPNCHHHFEKEPGYFTGAMYVSYALSIAEVVALLIALSLVFPMNMDYLIIFVISLLLGLSSFNFRISRLIWMYLF